MKVAVVGGGLLGIATAYFLSRHGIHVTLIERREEVALETSYANGGLLTPSMSAPWNSPGCWKLILKSFFGLSSALNVKLAAIPGMVPWGIKFLKNSGISAFENNRLSNLALARRSLEEMRSLTTGEQFEYARSPAGTLRLFRNREAMADVLATTNMQAIHGIKSSQLTLAQLLEREPALTSIADKLIGAIYYPDDEVGDAHLFCTQLADKARRRGVEMRFNTTVNVLERDGNAVTALITDRGTIEADAYVLAAGCLSSALAESVGVYVPVRPVKGYSLTVANGAALTGLRTPIVDDERHAVVVPLGNTIRVAAFADFVGFDQSIDAGRVRTLKAIARDFLPNIDLDDQVVKVWCGLRPVSEDGVPIIGRSTLSNLFLNTGHGHLGWTMAVGSGHLLADLIVGVDAKDWDRYSPQRFLGHKHA